MTIRFVHGGEPLLAGRSYTLECAVQKVAPVEHLKVTFYKGQERLAQKNSTRGDKKPVDEIFTHNFNVSAEDDGANYWCDAQLELEGQLVPPVESPQDLHATVHCEYCGFSSFPSFLFTVLVTRSVFFLFAIIQTSLGSYRRRLQIQSPSKRASR